MIKSIENSHIDNPYRECLHCGEDTKDATEEFCCLGCDAAYKMINKIGFGSYYKLREIISSERKIKPEECDQIDIAEFASDEGENAYSVSLMVQGLHCAACVWLIESILKKQDNVIQARINLSKKTLFLKWKGSVENGDALIRIIQQIGYKLLPFDLEILNNADKKYNDTILRAMAVAGFGAGNVMLISLSLWFSDMLEMGAGTRGLLHFFSSLIALPVIIYSARPFFLSAFKSIKAGFPNMDLAISIAVSLACITSVIQTFRGAEHVYFDSAVMLIFFLLIGRYLDLRVRKKAFTIASEFSLLAASFGRIEDGSKVKILPIKQLKQDMVLIVGIGEKIAADGEIIQGEGEVDTALITGETLPKNMCEGDKVYAGTINLSSPLRIRITSTSKDSLLSQIVALSEEAENNKNHFIRMSDALARFYIPVVHILAFLTFILWIQFGWEIAMANATAVLIITCPCALALAIPIIQTIAISNFIKKGILVKSGEALERMPKVDMVVFDKTGSLTIGHSQLIDIFLLTSAGGNEGKQRLGGDSRKYYLKMAASLAKNSCHPIALALTRDCDVELENIVTNESKGLGLESQFQNKRVRLGRSSFCDIKNDSEKTELQHCYMKIGDDELLFTFQDEVKDDAKEVIQALNKMKKDVILLSGDSAHVVKKVAGEIGIKRFYSEQTPISKVEFLNGLKAQNKSFIMVGDGVNDAPALALSDVSLSFNNASDIAQNVADIVIQGKKLMPIVHLIQSSERAMSLMKQNLAIALMYNMIAVPYAISGNIVPLIAAIAMSSSSLLVLMNSLRMNRCQF